MRAVGMWKLAQRGVAQGHIAPLISYWSRAECQGTDSGARTPEVPILALPLKSCVALSKQLCLSVPVF